MATAAKKRTSSSRASSTASRAKPKPSSTSSSSRSHGRAGSSGTKSESRAARSHPGSRTGETSRGKSAAEPRGGRARSRGKVEGAGQMTTDHEQIRQWVEARRGQPACVRGTGGRGDTGMLRIDMPGYTGRDKLQAIAWDEWFEKFEEKNLAFLYQDETKGGRKSNFNKLVTRSGK